MIAKEFLGIQSYCFRNMKTNAEVAAAVLACGAGMVEPYPGHLSAADPTAVDEGLAVYAAAGVRLNSYGVAGLGRDEASDRAVFALARKAGIEALSFDTDPGLEGAVDRLCQEYGIKAALHNHGRRHRLGSVWAIEELFHKTSTNVGLCLDTGWMLDQGEDPVAVARRFRDRLYGVHIKDFTFRRDGSVEDVISGTGNLDLTSLMAFLDETDYDGYITIEYEGSPDDPVPALAKCVEAVAAAIP